MKPPIIINANGDVYFYDALEKAQLDIEPIDVRDNIYVIYDSEGILLFPKVEKHGPFDAVKIYPSKENRADELKDILIDFFSLVGHDSDKLKAMSLKELVKVGLRYKVEL